MAVIQSEDFEAGTLGAQVQEANTIFSNVDNLNITYVAGLDGSAKACNISPTATGACRNSGFTAMSKIVVRFLFKITSAPTADCVISHMCLGDPAIAGLRIAHIYLGSNQKLILKNVYTTVATSTTVLAVNTEYAVEWMFDGVTKQQTLRIFTSVATTATASETLGPVSASSSGAATVDWVQVGKMTNTTWSGGITIDKYKRANDWVAAPAVVVTGWNEEFAGGTAGNNITLPVGWVSEGPNTALPKYSAVSPNKDLSALNWPSQSIGNRSLLSKQLAAGTAVDERYYVYANSKPVDTSEHMTIWSAGPLANTPSFRLVMSGGVGKTYNLELWKDTDWDPTAVTAEGGAEAGAAPPSGSFLDLKVDSYHRIEINTSATVGPATCTVKIWKDVNRNSTGAPDETISATCVSTNSLRYRRYGQMLSAAVADTGVHRQVLFDCIVATQNGSPVGPLALADQYDPPLPSKYTLWEWNGTTEIPLTIAGASTGGATLEEVGFDTGGVDPTPGDKLFTADPGLGKKLYVSADSNASPRYDAIADLYNFEMRTLSAGVGHPASDRCAPGCYRGFYGGVRPNLSWGKHSDTSWALHRRVAANTAISSWTFESVNLAGAIEYYDGTADNWMKTDLAPLLTESYERYGHLTIFDLGNEPDAWGKAPNQARVPAWFTAVRRAVRYMHFYLIDVCNVPAEAFMASCGTITQASSYGHETRHKQPIRLTETSWVSEALRGDALYYLNPDWKGTRTVSGGYWSDAYDPNPADFIQPNELDTWSYGRGPVSRAITHNFYERDYEYANIETFAEFQGKLPSLTGGYPRTGNLFKWNKALYGLQAGATSPVLSVPSANKNGVPVFIGELGIGVWVPLPSADNAAVPKDTADTYCNIFIKDLAEKCNVVGYAKWRYTEGPYNNQSGETDTFTHHWKVGSGANAGTRLWDPTNSNTKAEAAIFNTTYVADPPPWPNGTVRPPYVSRNNNTERDYRGFGDVPTTP